MNEPQVWTLIGVFAAALIGMITFTTQVIWRSINTQLTSLREEMKDEFASVRRESATQFESVRKESAAQMESLRTQLNHLDRDVQAISRRLFPSE